MYLAQVEESALTLAYYKANVLHVDEVSDEEVEEWWQENKNGFSLLGIPELKGDKIEFDDPRDIICGHLIGTADLIAQMADRCYLEKCRDRLYKEFVVGGVAIENANPGEYMVRYKSGMDLLKKTPIFYQQVIRGRLQFKFNRAYRYVEVLYDGQNPYIDAIRFNVAHLVRVLESGNWALLRRDPPYFLGIVNAVNELEKLVAKQLLTFRGKAIDASNGLLMPI